MLPRRFNDGREVPSTWIAKAILEIRDEFGAVSHETQNIEGHWQHAGVAYLDDLARIIVDVPDNKEKPCLDEGLQVALETNAGTARNLDGEFTESRSSNDASRGRKPCGRV
jgi:hypothetical protein